MKARHLSACIAIALALLGCATERPTRPAAPALLESTPISSRILADSSAMLDAVMLEDSTFEVDFAPCPLFLSDSIDDIAVSLIVELRKGPSAISMLEFETSTWKDIEDGEVLSGLYGCKERCYAPLQRLSSEIPQSSVDQLVSPTGKTRFRASGASGVLYPSARLIRWAPEYRFRKVLSSPTFQSKSLTYHDGTLFMYSDHQDLSTWRVMDSIVALDLSGRRLWATGFDLQYAYQCAFDGESFWFLNGLDGPLVRADSAGNVLSTIEWDIGYTQAMTFVNGSIWFATYIYKASAPVYEMDMDSSLATGKLVAHPRFTVSGSRVDVLTADDDGLIVVSESSVSRYTYSGTEIFRTTAQVTRMDAAAWDGESLWILHHGPREALTDATLLTRFTLE